MKKIFSISDQVNKPFADLARPVAGHMDALFALPSSDPIRNDDDDDDAAPAKRVDHAQINQFVRSMNWEDTLNAERTIAVALAATTLDANNVEAHMKTAVARLAKNGLALLREHGNA